MKRLLALLLAIVCILGMTSCKNKESSDGKETSVVVVDPNDPFTGTWYDYYEMAEIYTYYIFLGDGTGRVDFYDRAYPIRYEYTDTTFTLYSYPDGFNGVCIERTYKWEINQAEKVLFLNYEANEEESIRLYYDPSYEYQW